MSNLNELFKISREVIYDKYGIELIWRDKIALEQYLLYCKDLEENKFLKESAHGAAIHLFMLDTFGLDTLVLDQLTKSSYSPYKPEEVKLYLKDSHKKTEQLKAHIRNNLHLWRAERELL